MLISSGSADRCSLRGTPTRKTQVHRTLQVQGFGSGACCPISPSRFSAFSAGLEGHLYGDWGCFVPPGKRFNAGAERCVRSRER